MDVTDTRCSSPEHSISTSSSSTTSMELDSETYFLEAEIKLNALAKLLGLPQFQRNSRKQVRVQMANEMFYAAQKVIGHLLYSASGDQELSNMGKDVGSTYHECNFCKKLVNDLKCRFACSGSNDERYKILTCVPTCVGIDAIVQIFNCSQYMAREASKLRLLQGAFVCPIFKGREGLSNELKVLIRNFYLSTDNSRVNPAVRGTILVRVEGATARTAEAKRLIMMTLSELYLEFCEKYPTQKISLSAFSLLRPKQCVWSGTKGFQNTCTCCIHQNFELLLNACKMSISLKDFFNSCFCDTESESCMLGLCSVCPKNDSIEALFYEINDEEEISYNFWGSIDGEYGTQLQTLTKPLHEFQQILRSTISDVASHHFIMKKQQAFFDYLKSQTLRSKTSGILHLDLAQNYAFLYPNEIQSFYYTNKQATVHPFVLTFLSNESNEISTMSYIILSDSLIHNATAVHAFISKVIEQVKVDHPQITKIYYVSDGASSQYKNRKNFANLLFHKVDFGLEAEWHFTATSHGKSLCDAMGAVTKRSLRLASLRLPKPGEIQKTISNVQDMLNHCKSKLESSSMKFLIVDTNKIDEIAMAHSLQARYDKVKTIIGTQSHHAFIPVSENEIQIKRFSFSATSRTVIVTNIQPQIAGIDIGKYIEVAVEKNFVVGMVTQVDTNQLQCQVQTLPRKGKGNNFGWYDPPRTVTIHTDDIISVEQAPVLTTSTARSYRLSKDDFDVLKNFKKIV